jgi:DNA-binding CsgD family transcriptional regulator
MSKRVTALPNLVAMLAPDFTQARPSQMCHPAIEDAKDLIGPRQADGLSVIKSRLCAAASGEAEVLDRLIANAVADSHHVASGAAIAHRPSLRQPFVLIVSRLTSSALVMDDPSRPQAVVLVNDPIDAERANAELLIGLFGLARREAEVALAVVAGHGLRAVALQLGIALTTTRTHLQHVFEKHLNASHQRSVYGSKSLVRRKKFQYSTCLIAA